MKSYQKISVYIPKALGVREYAYEENINLKARKSMEDLHFIHDNLLQDASQSILFGILDGHGGVDVAKFVQTNFPKVFLLFYKQYAQNIPELLRVTFKKIDNDVEYLDCSNETGSTASIGFIRLENGKRVLYFANIGDSKAFLFSDVAIPLTTDHKPSAETEKKRILQSGGSVLLDRLDGTLAVSRAFGDFEFKNRGLTSEPDVVRIELKHIHKWLIVASDGLWDVVSQNEIINLVKYKDTADEISKLLVKLALDRLSTDNVSVICMRIQV